MNQPICFVAQIDLALTSKLEADLKDQGFTLSKPSYTIFQAKKKGISCTLYESGKLTVQGKNKHDFITFYLEPEILKTFTYSYLDAKLDHTPHIGVDEAGKGDVFGPLVIGSVFADEAGISELSKMGVRDSKRMGDHEITKLAKQIRQKFSYALIKIFPEKYNQLYEKFNNLNTLLGWGHATAIEEVLKKTPCTKVTIDKFAAESVVESALKRKKIEVELTQRHKGEEDIVVAAASIIARAGFVNGIETLSQTFNIQLPKGASPAVIQAGKRFVAKHGHTLLPRVAKMHFKTVEEIQTMR